jgi:hypothetical protein
MPIVCDLTNAPDTGEQRLAEYGRLFGEHLVDRERTGAGIRFRLRAAEGVEAHVRELAAREKACCAFFDFQVRVVGDEVHWDAWVVDDDIARAVLDEFYDLPVTAPDRPEEIEARLRERGLEVHTQGQVTTVA